MQGLKNAGSEKCRILNLSIHLTWRARGTIISVNAVISAFDICFDGSSSLSLSAMTLK
jgi:hypothetical protein